MAIDSGRIVANSVSRETSTVNCVGLYNGIPYTSSLVKKFDVNTNSWVFYANSSPTVSYFIVVVDPTSSIAQAYVWNLDQKTWKPVRIASSTIDPRTGKTWNPLASFYDPLAS